MKKVRSSLLAAALCAISVAQENPVTWSVVRSAAPKKAPKDSVAIAVTANIADGWHMYSISQPPGGPMATRIWLPEGQPFKQVGDIRAPKALTSFEAAFNMDVEFYEGSAEFVLNATPKSSTGTLHVNAYFQCCNERLCLPPKTVKLAIAATEK